MAWYGIGDVQGCHDVLLRLLDALRFDTGQDRLWLVGDLVNRGRQSAEVLRTVRGLGSAAVTVLGNHDLHLLAVASGARPARPGDTFEDVLAAPDREELLSWLATRPLLVSDPSSRTVMVHAGLLPQWDAGVAAERAAELESALRDETHPEVLAQMYGDEPRCWREDLEGGERLRVITNVLTRMRFVDAAGCLHMGASGTAAMAPAGCVPWFEHPERRWRGHRVVFGHWASLGLWRGNDAIGLDSGCVWGGSLSAVRLDAPGLPCIQQSCRAAGPTGDGG